MFRRIFPKFQAADGAKFGTLLNLVCGKQNLKDHVCPHSLPIVECRRKRWGANWVFPCAGTRGGGGSAFDKVQRRDRQKGDRELTHARTYPHTPTHTSVTAFVVVNFKRQLEP